MTSTVSYPTEMFITANNIHDNVFNKDQISFGYLLLSSLESESESESEKALLPSTMLHIQGICCGDIGACIK